jgi:hypothetical protein
MKDADQGQGSQRARTKVGLFHVISLTLEVLGIGRIEGMALSNKDLTVHPEEICLH